MSNLFNIRRFFRPDQPQAVYPLAVDASVRTWIPAFDEALNSARSRDRPRFDVRQHDWSTEQGGWMQPASAVAIRTWSPAWSSEAASGERTRARQVLDVRAYEWAPETSWYTFSTVDTVTPTRAGIWASQRNNADITPAGKRLDGRSHTWGSDGWPSALGSAPTIAAWAPAFKAEAETFRSSSRAALNVRAHEWTPEVGWFTRVVDAIIATRAPALHAERVSYRSLERSRLDVRTEWRPALGWLSFFYAAPPATTAQLQAGMPGPGGVRTYTRAVLDVRRVDPFAENGWLYRATIAPRHATHIVGVDVFVSGIAAGIGGVLATGAAAGLEAGTQATGVPAGGNDTTGLTAGIDDVY